MRPFTVFPPGFNSTGSMREGDWLIGYGCATSCYPSNIGHRNWRQQRRLGRDAQVHAPDHAAANHPKTNRFHHTLSGS